MKSGSENRKPIRDGYIGKCTLFMARPLRIEYPGAFYHITTRGVGRQNIFFNDCDKKVFLETLAWIST